MASITGKDGAISIGGGAVNGKVRNWRLRYEGTTADGTGAGDPVDELVPLRRNWIISGEFVAPDASDWDLGLTDVNTAVVVALKRKVADTNPWATGTGILISMEVNHPYDDVTTVSFEMRASGTDLSFDTTPA